MTCKIACRGKSRLLGGCNFAPDAMGSCCARPNQEREPLLASQPATPARSRTHSASVRRQWRVTRLNRCSHCRGPRRATPSRSSSTPCRFDIVINENNFGVPRRELDFKLATDETVARLPDCPAEHHERGRHAAVRATAGRVAGAARVCGRREALDRRVRPSNQNKRLLEIG